MSSPPRISFNKPTGNPTTQPYAVYNSGLPGSGYYNYETRPANVINNATVPVEFSQKPQTVTVERSTVVEQIPRPQYEKTYTSSAQNKRLAPEHDPAAKSTCCTPFWWVIAAILGLAGLTLALLFGLGVIGGSGVQKVAAAPAVVSPTTVSSTTPAPSNPTSTTPTTSPNNPPATTTTTSSATVTPTTTTGGTTTTSGLTPVSTTTTTTTAQPTPGYVAPASIPAQPVSASTVPTTVTHQQAGANVQEVARYEQHRHRLSVDE